MLFKNIFSSWKLPSKHLLVFKMSWRRLEDMSWKCLQHVFSVTNFCLPRRLEDFLKTFANTTWSRLEDVLKTSCKTSWRRLKDILKMSWKMKNCYAEDVLKMSWIQSGRPLEDMSWRRIGDILDTSKMFTGDICI